MSDGMALRTLHIGQKWNFKFGDLCPHRGNKVYLNIKYSYIVSLSFFLSTFVSFLHSSFLSLSTVYWYVATFDLDGLGNRSSFYVSRTNPELHEGKLL